MDRCILWNGKVLGYSGLSFLYGALNGYLGFGWILDWYWAVH